MIPLAQNMTIFSSCCFRTVHSVMELYIYFPPCLFTEALDQWFLTPHHSSLSQQSAFSSQEADKSNPHKYTGELMQKSFGWALICRHSYPNWRGAIPKSLHYHKFYFTLSSKNIPGSRSQLEMSYPSYRSHPLHHTNT